MTGKFSFLRVLSLVLLFILLILSGKGYSMDSHLFRFKFGNGNKYVYDIWINGFVETYLPNGINKSPVNIRMKVEQNTIDSNASNTKAKFEMYFKEVKMISGSDSQTLPEEGTKLIFEQDHSGNTSTLSNAYGWQSVSFSSLVFPENPIKPGDHWISSTKVNSQIPMDNRIKYVFTKVTKAKGRNVAIFTTDLLVPEAEVEKIAPPSQMKTSGKIVFDMDLGQIHSVESDSVFAFSIPIPELNLPVFTRTSIKTVMRLSM